MNRLLEELLPCPKCGGELHFSYNYNHLKDDLIHSTCGGCGFVFKFEYSKIITDLGKAGKRFNHYSANVNINIMKLYQNMSEEDIKTLLFL